MNRRHLDTADADPPIAMERSLAAAAAGRLVRIEGLHAGHAANRRLAELGLRSGSVVEVLQNHREDGVIVGLGSERLALPRSLASRIRIADGASQSSSGQSSSGQSSSGEPTSVNPLKSPEAAR